MDDHAISCLEHTLEHILRRWAILLPLLCRPDMEVRLKRLCSTCTTFVHRLEELTQSHQWTPPSLEMLDEPLTEDRSSPVIADMTNLPGGCLRPYSHFPSDPMPMTEVGITKRR